MKEYKVYIHRDSDGKVFYVGCSKTNDRPYRKYNPNNKYPKRTIEWYEHCNNQFTIEIIAEDLTEEQAFQMEIDLIKQYGRVCDGGILVNRYIGGNEGAKDFFRTDEYKQKLSESKRGENHPMYGKKHTEVTKEKMSDANKGKKRSDETKKKMSESHKGKYIGGKHPNAKKVICTVTGKIWDCVGDCAEENNLNYGTLRHKLNTNHKDINNTLFKYLDE